PDGDRLVVYDSVPRGWQPGSRVVLLVHGLGGSHRSWHIQRLARRFLHRGCRVVRMDLRGTGGGIQLARRAYHGRCFHDVHTAVTEVTAWCPTSPLILVGVSLGGNIVLKLAGEIDAYPVPNLECVAALAPPVDLARCITLLSRPSCRLYERHFLKGLVQE